MIYCSIVGAGSLVSPNKEFPPESLILGSPAKVVRKLTPDEIAMVRENAVRYVEYSKVHNQRQ